MSLSYAGVDVIAGVVTEKEKPVVDAVEVVPSQPEEQVEELAPEPEPETIAPYFVELLTDQVSERRFGIHSAT